MKSGITALLILLCSLTLGAQTEVDAPVEEELLDEVTISPEDEPAEQVVEYRAINENPPPAFREVPDTKWDKAAGSLDYSKDREKPPKPENEQRQRPSGGSGASASDGSWSFNAPALGYALQLIAIILAITGLAWGIYSMLRVPRNKKIARDGVEITIDNIEDYIHETDLDRFLRDALARNDYAQAVRLYYLQIIKTLSEKNAIRWSREKTNRDYLREMRQHRLTEAFKKATSTYEFVWYGNISLHAETYAALEPEFKSLLGSI